MCIHSLHCKFDSIDRYDFLPCVPPYHINLSKTGFHILLNGHSVNQAVITYIVMNINHF